VLNKSRIFKNKLKSVAKKFITSKVKGALKKWAIVGLATAIGGPILGTVAATGLALQGLYNKLKTFFTTDSAQFYSTITSCHERWFEI